MAVVLCVCYVIKVFSGAERVREGSTLLAFQTVVALDKHKPCYVLS